MSAPLSIPEMLSSLIASASVSSVSKEFDQSNLSVINLLANWLESLDFEIEIIQLPQQPDKANLIATLGKGPGGLVLAGHTDTVPFDEAQWQSNPFKLYEKEQKYFGLGIADMKGFFALAIEACKGLQASSLKAPLIILATADEESSMQGARTLVELGRPKARFAVIGEPTGLRPINAHKGILMEAIHLHGHAGHSSNPALGNNSIDGLNRLLNELVHYRNELKVKHYDDHFQVPYPTLNFGLVKGGDNPNRICSHAQLHFDLRMLPGMVPEALRTDIDNLLNQISRDTQLKINRESLSTGTAPMFTSRHSEIVTIMESLTGHASESAAYCTEGPYLTELGMETVIFGPGNIEQAHQPDEYLEMARIQPTVDILRKLIRKFCIE